MSFCTNHLFCFAFEKSISSFWWNKNLTLFSWFPEKLQCIQSTLREESVCGFYLLLKSAKVLPQNFLFVFCFFLINYKWRQTLKHFPPKISATNIWNIFFIFDRIIQARVKILFVKKCSKTANRKSFFRKNPQTLSSLIVSKPRNLHILTYRIAKIRLTKISTRNVKCKSKIVEFMHYFVISAQICKYCLHNFVTSGTFQESGFF